MELLGIIIHNIHSMLTAVNDFCSRGLMFIKIIIKINCYFFYILDHFDIF